MPDPPQPRGALPSPDRPAMPPGYGLHPAADGGLLPWSFVVERLLASRNYWVATTRPDGRPHVMPVWGVWLDDALYFSTDPDSRKARNIRAQPEIVVHLESGDEAVILAGRAVALTDPALRARFADAYEAKYRFRPGVDAGELIYGLRPRTVHAWLERDFPATATRWRSPAPRPNPR